MTTEPQIAFDSLTLAAVASELRAIVLPARVQKIQQPAPNDVILSLYGKSGACRLLISADPKAFRMHLTQVKRENPVAPPAFCQVCRKYLDGALLTGVRMPHFDRFIYLTFRTPEDDNIVFAVELMGRNSNIALVSGNGIIRGALRPTPTGADRSLRAGTSYTEPPGLRDRRDLLTVHSAEDPIFDDLTADPAEMLDFLRKSFSGVGRFVADEILARSAEVNSVPQGVVAFAKDIREENFAPYSIVGVSGNTIGVAAMKPLTIPRERRFLRESLSVALDTFYASTSGASSEDSERAALVRTITKEIAFREKELESARRTIAEAVRADEYERSGNNLLGYLAQITRGQSEIRVLDLYSETGDTYVTIALDPKRSPQENATSYFDRARKTRDAADYADGHAVDLEEDLATLRYLKARAEGNGDETELEQLKADLTDVVGEARAAGRSTKPQQSGAAHKPFGGFKVRKLEVNGYELLIGETAEANDYVTTRMASPSDLWMHVRSAPGAHAILRTNGQPDRMPESVIRRAAEIVAARSGTNIKHAKLVAVDIVEKRYVRKPRGAKAGLVSYQRERVVDVEPRL